MRQKEYTTVQLKKKCIVEIKVDMHRSTTKAAAREEP